MGQPFGKLPERRYKGKKLKILLIGLDNAGKTSLLKTMASEELTPDIAPTQGFNIRTVKTGFTLCLWDVGGQRQIRPYWEHHYGGTDCVVYVVDSTDRKRFPEAGQELFDILHSATLLSVPLLVLANKQDISTATPADDIVNKLSLHEITDREWRIQPCSASKNEGVNVGFDWLLQILINKGKNKAKNECCQS